MSKEVAAAKVKLENKGNVGWAWLGGWIQVRVGEYPTEIEKPKCKHESDWVVFHFHHAINVKNAEHTTHKSKNAT